MDDVFDVDSLKDVLENKVMVFQRMYYPFYAFLSMWDIDFRREVKRFMDDPETEHELMDVMTSFTGQYGHYWELRKKTQLFAEKFYKHFKDLEVSEEINPLIDVVMKTVSPTAWDNLQHHVIGGQRVLTRGTITNSMFMQNVTLLLLLATGKTVDCKTGISGVIGLARVQENTKLHMTVTQVYSIRYDEKQNQYFARFEGGGGEHYFDLHEWVPIVVPYLPLGVTFDEASHTINPSGEKPSSVDPFIRSYEKLTWRGMDIVARQEHPEFYAPFLLNTRSEDDLRDYLLAFYALWGVISVEQLKNNISDPHRFLSVFSKDGTAMITKRVKDLMDISLKAVKDSVAGFYLHGEEPEKGNILIRFDNRELFKPSGGQAPSAPPTPTPKPQRPSPQPQQQTPTPPPPPPQQSTPPPQSGTIKPIGKGLPSDLAEKLRKVYETITTEYVWPDGKDGMTSKIFFSTFMIRDSSILLKGVPGTGKTQLVEMMAMLWGNDVNSLPEEKKKEVLETREDLMQWLTEVGIIGQAKHNFDKSVQDIFFYSDIYIDRYKREDVKENPLRQKDKEAGFTEPPTELESYEFEPTPRPVTTSIIKMQNEANRMNSEVADTLLGMLAEHEVEFRGKIFYSPSKWEGDHLNLKERGFTSINIFDYNPHLEAEHPEFELDRALLDRITCSIYLPAGSMSTRYEILAGHMTEPRQAVFKAIQAGKLTPITREEWKTILNLVEDVPVSPELNAWMAFLTNIPNLSNKAYSQRYGGSKAGKMVDKSLIAFTEVWSQSSEVKPMSVDEQWESISGVADFMTRPLGIRSAKSLRQLAQAFAVLEDVRNGGDGSNAVVDGKEWMKKVLMLYPYVMEHRINLGLTNDAKTEVINAFDLFNNVLIPLINDDFDALTENIKKIAKGKRASKKLKDDILYSAIQQFHA